MTTGAETPREEAARAEQLSQADYRVLAEFRQALRRMSQTSEAAARGRGLTPQQHQALIAIKASEGQPPLSIGRLADRLGIRPHSTVELVDRLVQLKLVERRADEQDHRRVRVFLTLRAQSVLDTLAEAHRRELKEMRPALEGLMAQLAPPGQREPHSSSDGNPAPRSAEAAAPTMLR